MLIETGPRYREKRRTKSTYRCECGVEFDARVDSVKSSHTTSCGCSSSDKNSERLTTHGLCRHPLYRTWAFMVHRCHNENNAAYLDYGGRGIRVCDRWRDSFPSFLADMGERPEGHTLDRVDNNGDYCPENCRWATRKQQANNRRSSKLVAFNGVTQTLARWSTQLGISYQVLNQRLHRNWSVERAFTTPVAGQVNYDNPSTRKPHAIEA